MPGLLILTSRFRRRSGVVLVSGRLGIIDREAIYKTFRMPVVVVSLSLSLVLHHTSSHSLCLFSPTFLSEFLLRDLIISGFFHSF